MKALMDAARERGLTVIEGTVLRENESMLKLMEELDFSIAQSPEERDIMMVERDL